MNKWATLQAFVLQLGNVDADEYTYFRYRIQILDGGFQLDTQKYITRDGSLGNYTTRVKVMLNNIASITFGVPGDLVTVVIKAKTVFAAEGNVGNIPINEVPEAWVAVRSTEEARQLIQLLSSVAGL